MSYVPKTVLVAGVGWPEKGEMPQRFKHAYVKPVRVFKARNKYSKDLDDKFDAWLATVKPINRGKL